MTDNELLLAISNIVQSYTNPIQQQLQDTETRLNNRIDTVQTHLEGRIDSVQTDLEAKISALDDKIDSVQANLEAKISTLDNKIDSVQANLEAKISTLDDKIDSVQANLGAEIKQTQILLENDVLPRLQNIESCYTSTYQRYVSNVVQQETLQSDVDILKKVVAEHSELLQKIS